MRRVAIFLAEGFPALCFFKINRTPDEPWNANDVSNRIESCVVCKATPLFDSFSDLHRHWKCESWPGLRCQFLFFFFFKYHRIEDVYVFSGNLLLELSNICWNLYIIYYVYIILYYIIYILELQIYYEKICKMFEVATSFNERDTFSFRFHFFNCP